MPYPVLTSRSDLLKMLDELTQARRKILDLCERLTPEQLHDPVYPGTWSVLKNLAHLAWAEQYMLAWIKTRPNALPNEKWPQEPPHELGTLRTALDEAHAEAIAFLKSAPDSVFTEKCRYGRDAREETVGGVLFHLVEHEIGHRAFVMHKIGKLQLK